MGFTAHAQQAFPATLAGHAVMPALTVIPAPADAPADLRQMHHHWNGIGPAGAPPRAGRTRPRGITPRERAAPRGAGARWTLSPTCT